MKKIKSSQWKTIITIVIIIFVVFKLGLHTKIYAAISDLSPSSPQDENPAGGKPPTQNIEPPKPVEGEFTSPILLSDLTKRYWIDENIQWYQKPFYMSSAAWFCNGTDTLLVYVPGKPKPYIVTPEEDVDIDSRIFGIQNPSGKGEPFLDFWLGPGGSQRPSWVGISDRMH